MSTVPKQVFDLVEQIRPHFTGKEPGIVGAALADLLATLLAGHQGEGKRELREELLRNHIGIVRKLIPINEARMLAWLQERQQQKREVN